MNRTAYAFTLYFVVLLAFASGAASSRGRAPAWSAGTALDSANAIVIVEHVDASRIGSRWGQSVPGAVFDIEDDDVRVELYRLAIKECLQGAFETGDEIVFVSPQINPSSPSWVLPPLASRSLLVLARISEDAVAQIKHDLPQRIDAESVPDEMWTLVESREHWMSCIQLSRAQNGVEVSTVERSIAARQIDIEANIGLTEEAFVGYIKELISLRDAVLSSSEWRGKAAPESEEDAELDVFQRQVLRMALRKRAESKD